MNYHDFLGQVQHRARVASPDEAVRATRATLHVLHKRLAGNEASHLAAQLPHEIGLYLKDVVENERFDLTEFFKKVAEEEGVDLPAAVQHVRAVVATLQQAVNPAEIDDVRAQLPHDFDPLFESGSEGGLLH